ncbi:MAG: substrate-binding domain-containing protein [Chitinophagales bacterium]
MKISVWLMIVALCLTGCKGIKEAPIEDINKGDVTIWCDVAFQYAMDQQVTLYQHFNEQAHVKMIYLQESEILKRMMLGEVRTAILGRKLTDSEVKFLTQKDSLAPKQIIVARDATALVVSKKFSQKYITVSQLQNVELQKNGWHLVFENQQSGAVQQVLRSIGTARPGSEMFALKSANEVIDYVEKDDKAIGLIGFGVIADEDHPYTVEVLRRINILGIEVSDSTGKITDTAASQGDMAAGIYPLQRPVNYVLCNSPARVADGFVNYLARQRAAKVFLKAGIVPAVMPERMVTISTGLEAKN